MTNLTSIEAESISHKKSNSLICDFARISSQMAQNPNLQTAGNLK
jgi:hypothetical protein